MPRSLKRMLGAIYDQDEKLYVKHLMMDAEVCYNEHQRLKFKKSEESEAQ